MGVTRYSAGGDDSDISPPDNAVQRLLTDGGDPIQDTEGAQSQSVEQYDESEEVTRAQRLAQREEALDRVEGDDVPGRFGVEDSEGAADDLGDVAGDGLDEAEPEEPVEAVAEAFDESEQESVPAGTAGERTEVDWQSEDVPDEVDRGEGIGEQGNEIIDLDGIDGSDENSGESGDDEAGVQELTEIAEASNQIEVSDEVQEILSGPSEGLDNGRREADSDVAAINAQLPSDESVQGDVEPERDALAERNVAVDPDALEELSADELDQTVTDDPISGAKGLEPDNIGEQRGDPESGEYHQGVAPQQGRFADGNKGVGGDLTAQDGADFGTVGAARGEVTGERELISEYTQTGRAALVAVEEERVNASATNKKERALLMETSIGDGARAATYRDDLARNRTGLEAEERRVGEFQEATERRENVWYRADAPGEDQESLEQAAPTGESREQLAEINEILEEFGQVSRASGTVVAVRTDSFNREVPEAKLEQADGIEGVAQVTSTENYVLAHAESADQVAGIAADMPHVEEVVGEMSVADVVGRFQTEGVTERAEMGEFEHLEEVLGQYESPGEYWKALQAGPAELGGFDSEYIDVDGNGTWVGSQELSEFDGIGGRSIGTLPFDSSFPDTLTVNNFTETLQERYGPATGGVQTDVEEASGEAEGSGKTEARALLDALDEDTSGKHVRQASLTESQKDTLEGPIQHTLELNAEIEEAKQLLLDSSEVDMRGLGDQLNALQEGHQKALNEKREKVISTGLGSSSKEYIEYGASESDFVSTDKVIARTVRQQGIDALDDALVAELDDYIGGVDSLNPENVNEVTEEWLVEQAKGGIRPTRAAQLLEQKAVQVEAFTNGFTPSDTDDRVTRPLNEYTPERKDGGGARPVPKVSKEVTVTDVDDSVEADTGNGEVYQRFKVKDDHGNKTFVTVFKDGVEFPDHKTEGASGDYHENLADQAIHWRNRVGPGDKIKLDGFMVQDPAGKGITIDGNGTPSLASTPDSQIRIDQRQSAPGERSHGEVPSPDYSDYDTSSGSDSGHAPSGPDPGSVAGSIDPDVVGPEGLLTTDEVSTTFTQSQQAGDSDRVRQSSNEWFNVDKGKVVDPDTADPGADGTYGKNPDTPQHRDRSDSGF